MEEREPFRANANHLAAASSASRRYVRNIILSSAIVSSIFVFAVFLQSIPPSHLVSHPAIYPSPSLFPEFEDPSNLYCLGLHQSPATWEVCERNLERPFFPATIPPDARGWAPAPFKRSIALVFDAWRFDWAYWHPDLGEWTTVDPKVIPFHNHTEPPLSTRPEYGFNNYPILHNLLTSKRTRNNSRLFRMLADVPTMTTQRLRGLMCGDVPPFFDLSKSLAGANVERQDSLLYQLSQSKRRVAVLGDDTWDRLFGEYLSTVLIEEGFDIQDIDTIDDGIHRRLWTILDNMLNATSASVEYFDTNAGTKLVDLHKTKIYKDYEFVVAHLLGLDHIGHSALLNSIALHERQDMYDKFLSNVLFYISNGNVGYPFFSQNKTEHLWLVYGALKDRVSFDKQLQFGRAQWNDDTFMIAFGDHGMTTAGNHGGSEKLEVEAAFFYVSPRALIPESVLYSNERLRRSLPSTTTRKLWDPRDPIVSEPGSYETSAFVRERNYTFRSFDQVDVASTLSLMMGAPIPWDSLGGILVELFPLYNPETFRRHSQISSGKARRTAKGVEVATCIECVGVGFVAHPLLENDASWDALECSLAFDVPETGRISTRRRKLPQEDITYAEGSRSSTQGRPFRMSQMSWLRHLRYLAQLHHLNAWQIRRRQIEVAHLRPSVLTNPLASKMWLEANECYTLLTAKSGEPCDQECCSSSFPWTELFHSLEISHPRRHTESTSTLLKSLQERALASLRSDVEKDIDATLVLLARYRAFTFETQDILRKVESSNFSGISSIWAGLLPFSGVCIISLLWRENLFVPKNQIDLTRRLPMVVRPAFIFLLNWVLYIDARVCTDLRYQPPRFWIFPAGSIWTTVVWASVLKLLALYWDSSHRPFSSSLVSTDLIWGLLPLNASSIDSWFALISQPPGAITFGAFVESLDWVYITVVFIVQFAHGLVIVYQQGTARVLVHGYLLLLFCKGFHYIVNIHGCDDLEPLPRTRDLPSLAKYRLAFTKLCAMAKVPFRPALKHGPHLKLHSTRILLRYGAPWLLLALLVRLDDFTSATNSTPRHMVPRPFSITSPDAISIAIILITALLLFQLFPFETPSENFQRFAQSLSKLSQHQVSHFAHHLFFPLSHKAPSKQTAKDPTFLLRRPKRRQSGPSRFDPEPPLPAFSPEGCQSRSYLQQSSGASLDKLSPPSFTPQGPSAKDPWLKSRWPLSHLLIASIWIAQAILSSLYFACLYRQDLTTKSVASSGGLSPTFKGVCRLMQISDEVLVSSDSIKILTLLLPRINWVLGLVSLVATLGAPYQESFGLQMLGDLFFICLPLQTMHEAIPFCVQLIKFYLIPVAMSQTVSVARFSQTSLPRSTYRTKTKAAPSHAGSKSSSPPPDSFSTPSPSESQTPEPQESSKVRWTTTGLRVATSGILAKEFCELVDHDRTNEAVNSYRREIRASDGGGVETQAQHAMKRDKTRLDNVQTRYLFTDSEATVLIYLLMLEIYLGTGHRNSLSTLPLNAGFVGLTGFDLYLSPLLVVLHCGFIFLASPFVVLHVLERRPSLLESFSYRVVAAMSMMVRIILVMIWSNVLCLHSLRFNLPAWRDYAPKFFIELAQAILLTLSLMVVLQKTKGTELRWTKG